MGIFDGIGDAELFDRGKWLCGKCPGCAATGLVDGKVCPACKGFGSFRGVLEVKRTIAKETRNSGLGFIVEFEVIETNMSGEHPISSKCTWFQKMGIDGAQSSVKAWAAACCGFASHEKNRILTELSPHLAKMLEHATDNPADNDLTHKRTR